MIATVGSMDVQTVGRLVLLAVWLKVVVLAASMAGRWGVLKVDGSIDR